LFQLLYILITDYIQDEIAQGAAGLKIDVAADPSRRAAARPGK
jgi:hypothetical protein